MAQLEEGATEGRTSSAAAMTAAMAALRQGSRYRALLADLRPVLDAGNKAVVFSAHKRVVDVLTRALADDGIDCVKVVGRQGKDVVESSVAAWAQPGGSSVCVLHAGAAAAGLTLVQARHVFIIDVLKHPAEEAQALNRCHRIGQMGCVSCTVRKKAHQSPPPLRRATVLRAHSLPTLPCVAACCACAQVYFAPGTVEERLLAFRQHQNEGGALNASLGAMPVDSVTSQRGAALSREKANFVLGLADGGDGPGAEDRMADDE